MHNFFTNKLVFLVTLPLIFISVYALHSMKERLQYDAMEQLKGHMLELVQHYASSIGSELDKTSTITNTTALYLATNPIKNRQVHYELLENNLNQNKVIYGAAIAYEKSYFEDDALFAPYVFRENESLKRMELSADAYDYTESSYAWYNSAKNQMSNIWSEPYVDEDAGDILMITYSSPIIKKGKFKGVVTADLDLGRLNKTLNLDGLVGSDYVILTNTGHFAYHTSKELIGKSFINIADELGFERSIYIARKMITGEKGYVELADKENKVEMIFYAPIGDYGWSFALALKKESAYNIVFDNTDYTLVWTLFILIIGMILALLVSNYSLLKPIKRLKAGIEKFKNGKQENFNINDYPLEFKTLAHNTFKILEENQGALKQYSSDDLIQKSSIINQEILLKQADKRIMGLLSSAQNPVVIINSMGEILATNNKSESILKLKVKNMIGESILYFIDEQDKDLFSLTLEELFATNEDKEITSITIVSRTNVRHKVKAIFKPVFISEDDIEANIVFIRL